MLKARPLVPQLRDRCVPPLPDGLELYLDAQDIAGPGWLGELVERIRGLRMPDGFIFVVEGPMRSLDGSFFDISNNSPANVEVLRRLVSFGERIGARAAVIHAIAPREQVDGIGDELCRETLERSLPLLELYSRLCREAGLLPTIENVPPVTQMREEKFMHSLIGMEPRDIVFLAGAVEGVRLTLDVSHAQLYLNAAHADAGLVDAQLAPLVRHLVRRRIVADLDEYMSAVAGLIAEAHFSNAAGLLGEGLPYSEGDIDLDAVTVRLASLAQFLVTEIIEPDPDCSTYMREAYRRMTAALHRSLKSPLPLVLPSLERRSREGLGEG
ncbi:MAG: hypothetical protein HY675_16510 [Chloroflexi bacterium]|nr:hypothetical protein [Chloroflexota bacterium]